MNEAVWRLLISLFITWSKVFCPDIINHARTKCISYKIGNWLDMNDCFLTLFSCHKHGTKEGQRGFGVVLVVLPSSITKLLSNSFFRQLLIYFELGLDLSAAYWGL